MLANAGLSTPESVLSLIVPPAIKLPVLPQLKTACALPSFTNSNARTIEESFLALSACIGLSSISITSEACITDIFFLSLIPYSFSNGWIWLSFPTRITSGRRLPSSFTASATPAMTSWGPKSPPITSITSLFSSPLDDCRIISKASGKLSQLSSNFYV